MTLHGKFFISQHARKTISLRQWQLSLAISLLIWHACNQFSFDPSCRIPTSLFSFNCLSILNYIFPIVSYFLFSLPNKFFPINVPFSFPPTVGPQGHDLSHLGGPVKSLMQGSGSEMRKSTALGTNKAACIPTHGGSHIVHTAACTRNYTPTTTSSHGSANP